MVSKTESQTSSYAACQMVPERSLSQGPVEQVF